ncbi:MAG: hypothetical protein ACYYKD_05085 [Rhodospirillales bacterium]
MNSGVKPVRLRRWSGDDGLSYNGFTGAERIRGWQVQWWLVDMGLMTPWADTPCEVCANAASKNTLLHLEDYYDPHNAGIALCHSCHRRLHNRFKTHSWRERLKEFGCDEAAWAARLSVSPDADWAAPHRAKHGEDVRTCALFIPGRDRFPFEQLHPSAPEK